MMHRLGGYTILAAIGHGGMADVYLALKEGEERARKLLVVKQLRPNLAESEETVAMFMDEARLAMRLNHPNIVQTYEVGRDDEARFIAMEYMEGQPLHRVWRRFRSLRGFPLSAHLYILVEVLAALHYAHELRDYSGDHLGVVHRDVSPQNVFVTYEGQVKLMDFGIAKALDSSAVTKAGGLKGKLAYMSPEQARGDRSDRRADIFAVGLMLWEALVGHRLWTKTAESEILKSLENGELPDLEGSLPADTPAVLRAACLKALAIDREERFISAEEFMSTLEPVMLSLEPRMGRRYLSMLVESAFADERKSDEALIRERLRYLVLQRPELAAEFEITPTTSSGRQVPDAEVDTPTADLAPRAPSAPGTIVTAPPRRTSRGLIIGVLGVSSAIGVGAWALGRNATTSSAESADRRVAGDRPERGTPDSQRSNRTAETEPVPTTCPKKRKVVDLSGDIEGDATLRCDRTYLLRYNTFVRPGATLTIQAGTEIRGDGDTQGTLIVQPGARLLAEGSPELPIVFTSDRPPGERAPGDWGGVLILGNAPTNVRTLEGAPMKGRVEGLTVGGEFGGEDPRDDSGVLAYVRIEYAGAEIAPNNEINGLTLAGVGEGTRVHHVQVSHPADDCFEFFGGTVEPDHLICNDPGDDGLDYDFGYQGKQEFVVVIGGDSMDNAFEADNDPNGSLNEPRTTPQIHHASVCGHNAAGFGVLSRRAAQFTLSDSTLSGFSAATRQQDAHTSLALQGAVARGNRSGDTETGDVAVDGLCDAPPDKSSAPVPSTGADGSFAGAFRAPDDEWDAGWTKWD